MPSTCARALLTIVNWLAVNEPGLLIENVKSKRARGAVLADGKAATVSSRFGRYFAHG